MAVVQISRIQNRRGLATDLPQLAAGELGWVVDEQRLYIGNGTVADGAPAVGNTEIVTAGSSSFTTALSYVYKGYLGDSTPVQTGSTGDFTRTVQQRLDDYVSVKSFGAVGDDSTNDTAAIQRAIDELYSDTDETDTRSHRKLYFPAGVYRTNATITIPRYAHLVGDGPDKTVIRQSGGNGPVAVTEDLSGSTFDTGGIASGTFPTQIQVTNLTLKNAEAYGAISLDNASKVYFNNCKFEGTYASGGADNANSKGITVRSTNALRCSNIYFNQCQFTKFARLVDLSFDVTNVRFTDCDFSTSYYGAIIGDQWDASTTNGMSLGPRDIQFNGNSWSTIGQQAIYVKSKQTVEAPSRNIISCGNWYADTVANNFQGINSLNEVPVIQFDQDECTSVMDFFERTDQRNTDFSDSTDPSNTPPEVQGIGLLTKPVRQVTLSDATGSLTDTGIYLPGFNDKGVSISYKINRGTTYRTGILTISSAGEYASYNDDYEESNGDAGITLTAKTSDGDSTAGNDTIRVQYQSTSTGADATMEYQIKVFV